MITLHNLMGLDDSHLIDCHSGQQLQAKVCQAFTEMQQAARADGIDCQIASGYRSFSRQLSIWQRKWAGEKTLLDMNEKPLEFALLSDSEKLHAILTWSALPGTSRHHWGTDFDVYDSQSVKQCGVPLQLVKSEYEDANGPCFALNNWLSKNAEDYGFARPYQHYKSGVAAEPWHLSYKPLAQAYPPKMDINLLKQVLTENNINGLNVILSDIDSIYRRYVLNMGHDLLT